MKNIIFTSLVLLFISTSLTKDHTCLKSPNYMYEATVLGQGIDCDNVFLINLTSQDGNSGLINDTYYADELKPEFKIEGLKIILNCRKSNQYELYSCTCEGPGYDHVIVLECETAKDND